MAHPAAERGHEIEFAQGLSGPAFLHYPKNLNHVSVTKSGRSTGSTSNATYEPPITTTIRPNMTYHVRMSSTSSTRDGRLTTRQGARQGPFLTLLPHDVHYLIATRYVEFDTLLALRQTCRTLHNILKTSIVRRVRYKIIKDSLEQEMRHYQDYRSMYPRQRLGHLWDLLYAAFDFRLIERPAKDLRCYGCLQEKPLWCFVERMSNRGTGLGAKSAKDRMCKDCMRRYRDIEGQWWKENWIKKSDTIRKTSKSRRVRRWLLEGGSLVNPDQEIGVCSCCGSGSFELWWGCVACFELVELRCREEDSEDFGGVIERKLVDWLAAWQFRIEAKRRKRMATRGRRTRTWLPSIGVGFSGSISGRKDALLEWKDSKANQDTSKPTAQASQWRALDQIPLPKNRREARCSSCWIPNTPRRTYLVGMAYDRPLPPERWCSGCQHDHRQRHATRQERKVMAKARSENRSDGIFSEEWNDGLGCLFDQ